MKRYIGFKSVNLVLRMCLVISVPANGATMPPALIPLPQSVVMKDGTFTLDKDTRIIYYRDGTGGARETAELAAQTLRPATGYPLPVVSSRAADDADNAITFGLVRDGKIFKSDGYALRVSSRGAAVRASTSAGLFYGLQTLRQLLPPEIFSGKKVNRPIWRMPCVDIFDYPRFTWRGMHLDVGRHFMPPEFIKKYIDIIAMHKMNSVHWHLTEDQGWRIEIKKYPKLTQIGAWRDQTLVGHKKDRPAKFDGTRYGGFYTQSEIREIVEYARRRHVNIVPEIEMPGHCQAAIAAYPELGNTDKHLSVYTTWGVNPNVFNVDETTIRFLQNVLTEVMDLFPGKFIHIGGDEVPKTQWKNSPRAQARMKELGLHNESELQSYFIGRMDKFLTSKGRRLVGWDEILEGGLAPGATVMSWRGEKGGIAAAKSGHDVVMAPSSYTYFDHYQSKDPDEPLAIGGFLPLEKVYSYEPVPAVLTEQEATHVLGAQGQLWTEYIKTPDQLEYMAFPRACALAEVVWTSPNKKEWHGFLDRLETHLKRLDAMDVNYRKVAK